MVSFYPGRLLTSAETVLLRRLDSDYVSLEQTVVDAREVEETDGCEKDVGYDEDECLFGCGFSKVRLGEKSRRELRNACRLSRSPSRCLIEKSASELGCLHPRLSLLLKQRPELDHGRSGGSNSSNSSSNNRICSHSDLLPLTLAAEGRMWSEGRKSKPN